VMMGSERRSMIISEKDKKITAWHEAGHALVARLVPQCDPVHKVTIIPRGPALGLTQMLPKEDRLNWNRQAVLDRIAMAMGGRIAEELQFNEITSGAKSDIDHATAFARSMVCEWGMSEKLGPLAFGEDQQEVFLGREFGHRARNFSEKTAIDIDDEVRQIVTTQFQRAKGLLVENKAVLDRIAEALLEWETLDGADVEAIVSGQPLKARPAVVPVRPPEAKRPEVKEKSKILDALGGLAAPVPKVETGKA
jgi:cell division protease FtsH